MTSSIAFDPVLLSQNLRTFILDKLKWSAPAEKLTDQFPLLEVLDSMSLLKLAGFLEDELDVVIDEDDLSPESFHNINSIVALVARKQK